MKPVGQVWGLGSSSYRHTDSRFVIFFTRVRVLRFSTRHLFWLCGVVRVSFFMCFMCVGHDARCDAGNVFLFFLLSSSSVCCMSGEIKSESK